MTKEQLTVDLIKQLVGTIEGQRGNIDMLIKITDELSKRVIGLETQLGWIGGFKR